MRLVLLGRPGSGKGTQAKRLVERRGLTYIGTGEILRDAIARGTETGKAAKPLIDQGLLVPDKVVNDLVAELFCGDGRPEAFVTDGYPRTEAQAVSFGALLSAERLPLTHVIHLTIDAEDVVKRMLDRRREDDTELAIRQRLREFDANNDVLVRYYKRQGLLQEVPANGTPDEVFADILRALGVPATL